MPRSSRRCEEKIHRAEQAVARETAQARNAGLSSLVRVGTTILGAVMGRKMLSATNINKAGTALRNVGQTVKETGDVSRAKDTVESLRGQYAALEAEFTAESTQLAARIDPLTETLETVTLRPKKTNITPKLVALAGRRSGPRRAARPPRPGVTVPGAWRPRLATMVEWCTSRHSSPSEYRDAISLPTADRPDCAYSVLVSRAERRPEADFWPIGLRSPLPTVPVPLRAGDGDARLDLRAILDRVYDESGYPFYLYQREPDPPLTGEDAAWARTLISRKLEGS